MTLTTVTPTIDRDRWGRPLIKQATGKAIAYTRATTLAGITDDLNGLIKWKVGRAVIGIVDRPDLLLSAAAHRDDKTMLYKICDQALEAGGASTAATVGTAMHSFIEKVNRRESVGTVPTEYQADVAAYEKTMANFTPLFMEQMVVLDDIQVAGTPDLIVTYKGCNYIADLKTGSVDYPHKMAAQLGIYAHGHHYDHQTGNRTFLPEVDLERGIIIHLAAGTGVCNVHWIDIAAGWDNVTKLAVPVREWRKRRNLLTSFDEFDTAETNLTAAGLIKDPIIARIQAAADYLELGAIWLENKAIWSEEYTSASKARKAALIS